MPSILDQVVGFVDTPVEQLQVKAGLVFVVDLEQQQPCIGYTALDLEPVAKHGLAQKNRTWMVPGVGNNTAAAAAVVEVWFEGMLDPVVG
jgi:hypothetical protein